LKSFNATQAAKDAGYSEKTAYSIGHEILNIPEIADEIKRRFNEVVMSADEALKLLSDQARGTLDDCMDIGDNGKVTLNFAKAKEKGKLHLIKSIMPTANGLKVELYSSQRALELIAKAQGVFVERIEHSGEINSMTPEEWREERKKRMDKVNDIMD